MPDHHNEEIGVFPHPAPLFPPCRSLLAPSVVSSSQLLQQPTGITPERSQRLNVFGCIKHDYFLKMAPLEVLYQVFVLPCVTCGLGIQFLVFFL